MGCTPISVPIIKVSGVPHKPQHVAFFGAFIAVGFAGFILVSYLFHAPHAYPLTL
jgi:hypothetical protein